MCPKIEDVDEKGRTVSNEPETAEGHLAWTVALTPSIWLETTALTGAGPISVLRGLDMAAALQLAAAETPDFDRPVFLAALRGIEGGRFEAEKDKMEASNAAKE